MTWDEVSQKYGKYISKDPADEKTFNAVLHTFYLDRGHADNVLGNVSGEVASVLRPTNEGMSSMSGSPRYHVVHEGRLSGRLIKEYLVAVVDSGAEVWEVML